MADARCPTCRGLLEPGRGCGTCGHFPIASDTPAIRKAPAFAFSIILGAAVVYGVWYLISIQDPNHRTLATAAIPDPPIAPRAPARRGAVARSPSTGRLGLGNDFPNDADAESAARDKCGVADCILVESFDASCAAIAESKNGRRRVTHGHATREEAERTVLEQCGPGCSVRTVSCPDPR